MESLQPPLLGKLESRRVCIYKHAQPWRVTDCHGSMQTTHGRREGEGDRQSPFEIV